MGPGISDLLRKFQFLVLASSYQYWSPLGQEGRQPDWLPVLLNLFCVYLQSKCLFIHLFSLSFLLLVKKWRVVYLAPLIIIGQSQVNYHRIELGVSSFLPAVKQGHLSRLHLFCCFCCQSLCILKSRDITLPTKAHLVKAVIFQKTIKERLVLKDERSIQSKLWFLRKP